MSMHRLCHGLARRLAALPALLAALASVSSAGELTPGSLLLFPEYGSGATVEYLMSVTNTHPTQSIDTHWVYVDAAQCLVTGRIEHLTPNDTLDVVAGFHNPGGGPGFLYVTAVAPGAPLFQPVAFEWLIGNATRLDGFQAMDYVVEAAAFHAIGEEGTPTDSNANGRRDFDGIEYSTVPDLVLVPRFLGQDRSIGRVSELVLLDLSGGAGFTTVVDFLIYNDNEEVFSAQHQFECWTKVELLDISQVFSQDFLSDFTHDDPNEILGAPDHESGWIRLDGDLAASQTQVIADPAILAFFLESSATGRKGADLPFGIGSQTNGVAPVAKLPSSSFAPKRWSARSSVSARLPPRGARRSAPARSSRRLRAGVPRRPRRSRGRALRLRS